MSCENNELLINKSYSKLFGSVGNICFTDYNKNRQLIPIQLDNYCPQNPLKILIPKSNARKGRTAIIPSFYDWSIFNALIKKIRIPLLGQYNTKYEESLEEHIFNYQKAKDSLRKTCRMKKYDYIVKIDVKNAFNSIKRNILYHKLKANRVNKEYIELLNIFLEKWAGIEGVPIIWLQKYSTLFNIYTHEIKRYFLQKYKECFKLSTDSFFFALSEKDDSGSIVEEVRTRLSTLSLSISSTKIFHSNNITSDIHAQKLLLKLNNHTKRKEFTYPEIATALLDRNYIYIYQKYSVT